MTVANQVIDFHVRLAPGPDSVARLLAAMDTSGIDRAVICPGGTLSLDQLSRQVIEGGGITAAADNDAVLDACKRDDGRLVPYFFANPHQDPAHYADHGADFAGMEISPAVHAVGLDDARTTQLVELARDFGHSVYVVCIARPGCQVADLVALAERYPEVTFVLGHAGVTPIDLYALDLIAPHPNVVLETSGGYLLVTREAVRRLGADRVLFGSEYPLQRPELELDKIRYADLDEDAWRQVVWSNAHRVLRLPEPA